MQLYQDGKAYVAEGDNYIGRDTLEAFIESCSALGDSWRAFGQINAAESAISQQQEWLAFREWLFKVLYYNPDTLYYCGDVGVLVSTFNYVMGPRGDDMKGVIAVEEYIVKSGKCPILQNGFQSSIEKQWRAVYVKWLDTVKDSIATPFDSTLPTLQQIGFEILFGPQYVAEHHGVLPGSVLGAVTASPDPFTTEAELTYSLNMPATLMVEVFDVLGTKVRTVVPGLLTNEGIHALRIGDGLTPGTYYVRVTVPEGDVTTVKIVKR